MPPKTLELELWSRHCAGPGARRHLGRGSGGFLQLCEAIAQVHDVLVRQVQEDRGGDVFLVRHQVPQPLEPAWRLFKGGSAGSGQRARSRGFARARISKLELLAGVSLFTAASLSLGHLSRYSCGAVGWGNVKRGRHLSLIRARRRFSAAGSREIGIRMPPRAGVPPDLARTCAIRRKRTISDAFPAANTSLWGGFLAYRTCQMLPVVDG